MFVLQLVNPKSDIKRNEEVRSGGLNVHGNGGGGVVLQKSDWMRGATLPDATKVMLEHILHSISKLYENCGS